MIDYSEYHEEDVFDYVEEENVESANKAEYAKDPYYILECRREDIIYTDDQQNTLIDIAKHIKKFSEEYEEIDDLPNKYILVEGFAGTGKTTIVENIINYINYLMDFSPVVLTPTNKAGVVLQEKLRGIEGTYELSTLHSKIYGGPTVDNKWIPKQEIIKNEVILIDECSMVDTQVLNDLLSLATSNCLIIMFGDSFQLEPVGENPNLFTRQDFWTAHYKLTQVRRQSVSELLNVCTDVRLNNSMTVKSEFLDNTISYIERIDTFTEAYIQALQLNADAMYLLFNNQSRVMLNNYVRERLGYTSYVEDGEKLISIANSSSYGDFIANGEIVRTSYVEVENMEVLSKALAEIKVFTLSGLEENKKTTAVFRFLAIKGTVHLCLIFPDLELSSLPHQVLNRWIKDNPDDEFTKYLISIRAVANSKYGLFLIKEVVILTYTYAITVHKAQGSQFEFVWINTNEVPKSPYRWFYTALTRATKKVYLHGNNIKVIRDNLFTNELQR